MIGCPNSIPMRADLRRMMVEGKSDKDIQSAFVDKYTSVVLSAPSMTGFNLTAWVMPFAALAAGLLAVFFVARNWRAKAAGATPVGPIDVKYQSRVEEELKKYSPED